jgi:hypothetical protein
MDFSPGALTLQLVDQKSWKRAIKAQGQGEPLEQGHELAFWCVKANSLKNPIREVYRIFYVKTVNEDNKRNG